MSQEQERSFNFGAFNADAKGKLTLDMITDACKARCFHVNWKCYFYVQYIYNICLTSFTYKRLH